MPSRHLYAPYTLHDTITYARGIYRIGCGPSSRAEVDMQVPSWTCMASSGRENVSWRRRARAPFDLDLEEAFAHSDITYWVCKGNRFVPASTAEACQLTRQQYEVWADAGGRKADSSCPHTKLGGLWQVSTKPVACYPSAETLKARLVCIAF